MMRKKGRGTVLHCDYHIEWQHTMDEEILRYFTEFVPRYSVPVLPVNDSYVKVN